MVMVMVTRMKCPECGSRSLIRRAYSYDYCTTCGWKGEDNCCELQYPFGGCICQCHKFGYGPALWGGCNAGVPVATPATQK